eukprot:GHVL01028248.1.p1 GENE.GHVL01028248.1~~GHVL01028248.1.p1  ORF type:complete len:195 (-),score=34.52 GHVL01028248.1:21-605(-)
MYQESPNKVYQTPPSVQTDAEGVPIQAKPLAPGETHRHPYFESREEQYLETKERTQAEHLLGRQIRDACRAEIDEYIDCMTPKFLTVYKCRGLCEKMRRCVRKIETPEYVERRLREIMAEREANNTSLIRRTEIAAANSLIDPTEYAQHRQMLQRQKEAEQEAQKKMLESKKLYELSQKMPTEEELMHKKFDII